jgi:hypothetical protein
MPKKEQTLAERVEHAVDRKALDLSDTAGYLTKPRWEIRNELRASEKGRQLAALAKSRWGREPWHTIVKDAEHADALKTMKAWEQL